MSAFEAQSREDLPRIAQAARALSKGGAGDLVPEHLTRYSRRRATEAHALGAALLGSIEARSELLFGRPPPEGPINAPTGAPTPSCLPGADPDRPPP